MSATTEASPLRRNATLGHVTSALYVAFLTLAVLRLAIDGGLLDLVMNYRADEGSVIEKLHPANYGFAALAAFALSAFRIELSRWETQVLRAMLALLVCIVGMIVFTIVLGIGSSVGFLIDNYVGACFSALLFLFPAEQRRRVGQALMIVFTVGAVVALAEFALKTPLLPHPPQEATFRPVGLTSHPLQLGLWCAVTIPFATAAGWSRRVTTFVCVLLLGGLAVSGARSAMLAGGICALVVAVASVKPQHRSRRRLERRLMLAVFAAFAVPMLIGVLYIGGALERFQDSMADDSAAARIAVYSVFDYMNLRDFLFGVGTERLNALATQKLHLFAVESAVVVFIGLFGLIGALIFALALFWLMAVLLRGARPAVILATVLYFGVALTNNSLASKEPSMISLMILIIAFRPPEDAKRFRSVNHAGEPGLREGPGSARVA